MDQINAPRLNYGVNRFDMMDLSWSDENFRPVAMFVGAAACAGSWYTMYPKPLTTWQALQYATVMAKSLLKAARSWLAMSFASGTSAA